MKFNLNVDCEDYFALEDYAIKNGKRGVAQCVSEAINEQIGNVARKIAHQITPIDNHKGYSKSSIYRKRIALNSFARDYKN